MSRRIVIAAALAGALALQGCESMSDTTRRTTTGAALGGIAAGALSGEWGWAAAGAAAGAVGGYLYDQHKKGEEDAYHRGVRDGRGR